MKKKKNATAISPTKETTGRVKALMKAFHPSSHKINLFNPSVNDDSDRYFKIKDKDGSRLKLYAFPKQILLEVPVKTSMSFGVNKSDKICFFDKMAGNSKIPFKIFVNRKPGNGPLACLDLIGPHIQQLGLKKSEGLFIYPNCINLAMDNDREIIPELLLLKKIKKIIEKHFPGSKEEIDTSKIPVIFSDLVPLLDEWAISDDLEREEKLRRLSKSKQKKLVDLVGPKLNAIDDWLNSFKKEPMPHEATLIGDLAGLVAELKII